MRPPSTSESVSVSDQDRLTSVSTTTRCIELPRIVTSGAWISSAGQLIDLASITAPAAVMAHGPV